MDNCIFREKPRYYVLEYVETTGTQFIDTGVVGTSKYKIVMDFAFSRTDTPQRLFGYYYYSNSNDQSTGIGIDDSYFRYANPKSTSYTWTNIVSADTNRHTFTYDWVNLKVSVDSTQLSINNYFRTSPYTYPLFCYQSSDTTYTDYTYGKFYSCQIYNSSGVLVRDFIPIKRLADNTVMLYDEVNEKFYTNVGSGSFIAGKVKRVIY